MIKQKWGYGPNGERELFPESAPLPDGWALTPAVFWTDEERQAPEWPEWYVKGTGRPSVTSVARITLTDSAWNVQGTVVGEPLIDAPLPAPPKRRGRPPKVR